jgi:DNA (cytosine-5)-methyltransferase 1
MKVFSTFTGIGGFEVGIHNAYLRYAGQTKKESQVGVDSSDTQSQYAWQPATFVGYSEIDRYAISVYERHFKGVKNYGDITKINADELPDFDILVGGFPCQAFSIAGKRRGFEDTRGTLFFELARILKAKTPRLFVFENVKGLLNHDSGNTFKTIISAIDELGYDCQWQVLNSKNHGVPQNRERVIIVGHLRGTPRPEVFPIGCDSEQVSKTVEVVGTLETDGWEKRFEQIRRVHSTDGISPTIPTGTGGGVMTKIQVREATKKGYAEATVGDSINLGQINSTTRRGRVGVGVANTIDTGIQQHTLTSDARIRRLTPLECERLQGFPDNWTQLDAIGGQISDTQRYKMCGNAVTTNVIQAVFERIFESGL